MDRKSKFQRMKCDHTQKGLLFLSALLFIVTSCGSGEQASESKIAGSTSVETTTKKFQLFTSLDQSHTGITFNNRIEESKWINTFSYINSYNGGGVAIGDVNNDGLPDVFLSGNMINNELYLNLGNMQFQNITSQTGVGGEASWSTGATMGDVNNDGWIDIYVCRSFMDEREDLRGNLLYINNGDGSFTESATPYGVDDNSYSTQATFLDYDLDGDIDLFVGNNPRIYNLESAYSFEQIMNPQHATSDHLYRNNGDGSFTDVTIKSGILNYGFMLGVVSGDFNNDGWPDIYVANDHQEPDILYLNNGDGTFRNGIQEMFKHISYFSMGVDLADFNNDCNPDLFVVDMMAEDNYRQKTQMASMNPKGFWAMVDHGYHYQYMRNVLQMNTGNGQFSEIGQMAGISQSDWSWATLIADFDNDGWKDIFISNGFKRDIKDKDLKHDLDEQLEGTGGRLFKRDNLVDLMSKMPSTPISNKFYKNNGALQFSDMSSEYGLGESGFSNGAAYADLDGDGDLDLVVNNINNPAFVYRNNTTEELDRNFLRIHLLGDGGNRYGLGAKITITTGDTKQYQELTLTRGFQSSVENIVHFGLGETTIVDELHVKWPDGRESLLNNIEVDRVLEVFQQNAKPEGTVASLDKDRSIFREITKGSGMNFVHQENAYDDYEKESLLPHKMSQFGPGLATGDVDGNGLDDVFVGNATGSSGKLFLQKTEGNFLRSSGQPWDTDRNHEDIGALFFDADGDKDLDLYVVSGGNEFEKTSPLLQDRLYINDGSGNFTRSKESLPVMISSGSCVVAGDYDGDGDQDLFVGGRVVPGKYPYPAQSFILNNEGGKFTDVTSAIAAELVYPGLVTSAEWMDFDDNGSLDLIVVGEWMPLSFFKNESGSFRNVTDEMGMKNTTGWWNKIVSEDMDGDGDLDLVAGNLGLNYKYQVSNEEPLHIYCEDFDRNGTYDIVLGYYNDGTCFPVRGRQCSSEQMPMIKDKFPTYDKFALATLEDIYGADLGSALHYEARSFKSVYLENKGNGNFEVIALPPEAQISAIFGIITHDLNADGNKDILISGNFYVSEVETGRADAGTGLLMLGDGNGTFTPQAINSTGFFAPGDVRDMTLLDSGPDHPMMVLVGNNDGPLQVFQIEVKRRSEGLSMR